MFKIHAEFKATREIISLNKVYIYFNKLHESQQMYLLNYKEDPENIVENDEQIVSEVIESAVKEVFKKETSS